MMAMAIVIVIQAVCFTAATLSVIMMVRGQI